MNKKRILLVEDDELDIISVERSLKKLDIAYELFTAYNGIEALEILRGKGTQPMHPLPSIILLDVNMPKMNGIEFLKILREENAFKHIKVFVMTTSGEEQDRKAMEQLDVSGYLIKPLNFNNNNKGQILWTLLFSSISGRYCAKNQVFREIMYRDTNAPIVSA